ncbi:MAG: cache domain-containing protein, partial [Chloroflexi bacterium]|nr:cache domain-containing protein [Chloroflexota bacterium]
MTRLLAHVALALIILAAMFMLVGVQERARALAEAQRDLASHAQFTANALDRVLQIRMTQTFTFAALPSLRGFAASDEAARPAHAVIAQTELQAIAAADPNVRACSITDIGGNVILTTDGSMNKNWGERLFAREALAGQLHASVPSRDFGEISQYYSAPILDNAGNVAGALVIRV